MVALAPTLEGFRRRIVHEDESLLVLDKPAGWAVHGDRHHAHSETLLSLALSYLHSCDCEPAFAHRLDKDTSGLMVMAKTPEALRHVNRQLRFKQVHKAYVALLAGTIVAQGSIRLPLEKRMDRKRWLAVMVPVKRGGVFARTDFTRLEQRERCGQTFSLVEAHPLTGRTHQLRAHFAALGYPLVGDDLYGDVELNERLRLELGLSRHLLHAARLALMHPVSQRQVTWEAPLPEDFSSILQQLAIKP